MKCIEQILFSNFNNDQADYFAIWSKTDVLKIWAESYNSKRARLVVKISGFWQFGCKFVYTIKASFLN